MLQYIRDRAKGWLAWLIILLLIIPFALWGINQYFQGGGASSVATVNDTDISLRQFQQALAMQRDRVRNMLGENANADLIDSIVKPRQVLEGLVDNEVLYQEAKDEGYRVSEEQLAMQIRSIKAFQQGGKFSVGLYEQLLRSQGETTSSFESRMRRSMLINQLNNGLEDTVLVTDQALNNYISLDKQTRNIGYVIVPASKFNEQVKVSDEEIEQYYNNNRSRFMNPEKVSIEYVELDAKDLAKKVAQPSEDELRTLYEENKDQFGVGEERRARHILISVPPDADKETQEKAREKAEKLLKRIKAGESFEKLAKEYSDDPGSASKGGDLGFFGRGTMEEGFEDAAFALKKGEVSGLVKTSFGFHIIKLEDIHPATYKSFKQVHDKLVTMYREKKAETQFYDQAEELTNLAYEKPDSLLPISEELGLKIKTTEKFSRGQGKGIAANPKVVKAAFNPEVLKQGYNSEPIELGVNHVVVLRVKDHEPESQRQLDEVKDEIRNILVKNAASEKAQEAGNEIVTALSAGDNPETVLKERELDWNKKDQVGRKESKVNRQIVDYAFKLLRPTEDKAVVEGIKLNNGDFAVVQLYSVNDVDPSSVPESERKSITRTLKNIYADEEFKGFLADLKENASVAVHEENL
jgi:peptidyl-prolyl cis-trans isomerase D